MRELAFNEAGELIDVPTNAVGWQVRMYRNRGPAQLVYSAQGLPLVLPLEATLAELGKAVQREGRYRLDPIDEQGRRIAGASAGYVWLELRGGPGHPATNAPNSSSPDALLTAMRTSVELATMILGPVEMLLDTTRTLLRAAEDANRALTANRELMK